MTDNSLLALLSLLNESQQMILIRRGKSASFSQSLQLILDGIVLFIEGLNEIDILCRMVGVVSSDRPLIEGE